MYKRLSTFILIVFAITSYGQEEDHVLFTVADQKIHLSEFDYIYNKNNNEEQKYTQASLHEYLDLYINFKLKVQAAKDMQLDTLPELQKELKGYLKQLADSYLTDKQMKNDILMEAYERTKKDVEIAHILIKTDRGAKENNASDRLTKALNVKQMLDDGQSFEDMVAEYSDDANTKSKKGRIGYVNATLPPGFYDLENAAYSTPVGEVSEPVRSRFGFHLIKVLSTREARGEMEASQILIRNAKSIELADSVKHKADMAWEELKNGADWADIVKRYSQDETTKSKKGSLGFFGINKYDRSFENAAFAIEKDGDFTLPVKTKLGWHIIRRDSKRDILPFRQAKYAIDQKLKNSPRIKRAENIVIERIRNESEIKTDDDILSAFVQAVDTNYYKYDWDGFSHVPTGDIIEFKGGVSVKAASFDNYLSTHKGQRVRSKRFNDPNKAISSLYEGFVKEQLIEYEKTQLPYKYPAFKALMREYDEGILLFEVTKRKVWDYALADTVGLKAYFDNHLSNYQWGPRLEVSKYVINSANLELAKKIRDHAENHEPSAVMEKYGKEELVVHTLQKVSEDQKPASLKSENGNISSLSKVDDNTLQFYKVESQIAPGQKELREVRGFALADYQKHLEERWIAELKKTYDVRVDEALFESLIKK